MRSEMYGYSGAELLALYGEETDPELMGFLSLLLPAIGTLVYLNKKGANP